MVKGLFKPDSKEWEDALRCLRHDFYHLPAYARLTARQEGCDPLAYVATEGSSYFLLPLLLRRIPESLGGSLTSVDAITPWGYPGPLFLEKESEPDFVGRAISGLYAALADAGVISLFCRLHPLLNDRLEPLAGYGTLVHHGETVVVDLSVSVEDMWRQMRSTTRNEIRKARAAGYEPQMDMSSSAMAELQRIYTETMLRVGASDYYFLFDSAYFVGLKEALGDRLHVCVVRKDDQPACAALFVETDGLVQYHVAGTDSRHLRFHPSKVMLHYIMEWAKSRGNRFLHLGGGVEGKKDSLFAFKAGFSPGRRTFTSWRLVVLPENYKALLQHWEAGSGASADLASGYFPAYRKPVVAQRPT